MSTYLTVESAVLTLLRAYNSGATFTTANSSLDDWTIIDTPATSAFVEMGEDSTEDIVIDAYGAHGDYQEKHVISLWICMKRSGGAAGDAGIKQALKALTEGVKDYLRPFRTLGSVARAMELTSTTPPLTIRRSGRDPGLADASHFGQRVHVTVWCDSASPDGESEG